MSSKKASTAYESKAQNRFKNSALWCRRFILMKAGQEGFENDSNYLLALIKYFQTKAIKSMR